MRTGSIEPKRGNTTGAIDGLVESFREALATRLGLDRREASRLVSVGVSIGVLSCRTEAASVGCESRLTLRMAGWSPSIVKRIDRSRFRLFSSRGDASCCLVSLGVSLGSDGRTVELKGAGRFSAPRGRTEVAVEGDAAAEGLDIALLTSAIASAVTSSGALSGLEVAS